MGITTIFNGIKAWIIPQEKKFFDLFDRQAIIMADASAALVELFERYDGLEERRDAIKEIENRGDEIVKEVYALSNFSFITPLDHEDITALIQAVDDVIDLIYAVANRVYLYKIEGATSEMKSFAEIIEESVTALVDAIKVVRAIKPETAEKLHLEINLLEKKADHLLNETIASLLEDKDAKEVIRYKEVYEFLEEITDKALGISSILLDISIKYS